MQQTQGGVTLRLCVTLSCQAIHTLDERVIKRTLLQKDKNYELDLSAGSFVQLQIDPFALSSVIFE